MLQWHFVEDRSDSNVESRSAAAVRRASNTHHRRSACPQAGFDTSVGPRRRKDFKPGWGQFRAVFAGNWTISTGARGSTVPMGKCGLARSISSTGMSAHARLQDLWQFATPTQVELRRSHTLKNACPSASGVCYAQGGPCIRVPNNSRRISTSDRDKVATACAL